MRYPTTCSNTGKLINKLALKLAPKLAPKSAPKKLYTLRDILNEFKTLD
jgi:hypothetical protein